MQFMEQINKSTHAHKRHIEIAKLNRGKNREKQIATRFCESNSTNRNGERKKHTQGTENATKSKKEVKKKPQKPFRKMYANQK